MKADENILISQVGDNTVLKKQRHKLEECVEKVEEKEMPLLSYIIAHPEAKLSAAQRKKMADWFKVNM